MRLQQYIINESEVDLNKIIKECSIFIKDYIKCDVDVFLYRGYNSRKKLIKKNTRKDRIPKDTLPDIQELIDDIFYEKFKVRPRSNSVFTTSNYEVACRYGSAYIVLPIGDYKII